MAVDTCHPRLMATELGYWFFSLDIEYFDRLVVTCRNQFSGVFSEDKRPDLFVMELVFTHFIVVFPIKYEYTAIGCSKCQETIIGRYGYG